MMIGKRGVLGETITWFQAFLIIFFILFVFLFSSLFIQSGERVLKFPEGETTMNFAKILPAIMSTNLAGNALELGIIGYFLIEKITPMKINVEAYDYIKSRDENIFVLLKDYLSFRETKEPLFTFKFIR